MKHLLKTALLAVVASLALGAAPATAQTTAKPNILVIWGDDIGTWNISHNNRGMMGYKTPNIDRIAKEGVAFTDYYGQQSCTAGRAAFIGGTVPLRSGMTKVGMPGAAEGWQKTDVTMVTVMKSQGYATGQFGNASLLARRMNYYATVPAPATVSELIDVLDEQYGIDMPLVDLFLWGAAEWTPAQIKGAMVVGPSVVAGTTCDQYAFRQDEVDYQIWIQKGDYPLPRKIVITTKTDEARPQHTAVYTWNLAPSFNDAAFVLDPPTGALRVPLAKITAK